MVSSKKRINFRKKEAKAAVDSIIISSCTIIAIVQVIVIGDRLL